MNLILLEKNDRQVRLKPNDRRVVHIKEVLRMNVGDYLYVGVEGGSIGKALIKEDDEGGMLLEVDTYWKSPAPLPVHLLVGLPRPQTARRLLREIPSLGVEKITFFLAEKSEPSYRNSKLWSTFEWQQQLREGTEQAFVTHIPEAQHADTLAEAIGSLSSRGRLAFDLYEAKTAFYWESVQELKQMTLAFGPEGGWTESEREILREESFKLCTLGPRVMRVETAVIAATSLAASYLERLDKPLVPDR